MYKDLTGKVALVTGGSRGVGKGIAIQLAQAGATVYYTGRTTEPQEGHGSLDETCKEIKSRGGKCIPVQCDHSDDKQIADLFERISSEQNGRLDILVNNVFTAMHTVMEQRGKKFWEMKPEMWDEFHNVGLRNHYICSVHAARMMVPRRTGLIVYISSIGGTRYFFDVLYGIGKAAIDRMCHDCGVELREHNIATVSLALGAVHTEYLTQEVEKCRNDEILYRDPCGICVSGKMLKEMIRKAEGPEFIGKVVVHMATDPDIMKYSGKTVIPADYAQKHNIVDENGSVVPSYRQLNYALLYVLPQQLRFVCDYIPNFVKVPTLLMEIANSKF